MSTIKITILGTTAGVPTKERAHSSVHLRFGDREETCILFDCGEGTQRQMLRSGINLMKLDLIFITHWHGDHCLGLPGLLDTMGFEGRDKSINVYAPEARRANKCLNFTYSMAKFPVGIMQVPHKWKKISTIMESEAFTILSAPVEHSIPTVAYAFVEKDRRRIDKDKAKGLGLPEEGDIYARIKSQGKVREGDRIIRLEDISSVKKGRKIVYSGDTEICGTLEEIARDADLLIQDCTYFFPEGEDRPHRHASLPEVLDMVKSSGVKRVILTHISRKHQDMDELRRAVEAHPNVEVAEDFMEIQL